MKPLVIGHRGASVAGRPEASLATLAYSSEYSDIVEWDLQWTSDRQPVILNNDTLDRTTNGTGKVDQYTLEQIKKLIIKGSEAETIPTFEEAVALLSVTQQQILPQIRTPYITDGEAQALIDTVKKYNMLSYTRFQSIYLGTLDQLRRIGGSKISVCYLSWKVSVPTNAQVNKYGGILLPYYRAVNRSQVAAYQAAGIKVWLWTADNSEDEDAILALLPDGIITNRPEQTRTKVDALP